jgi:hypothetical protein
VPVVLARVLISLFQPAGAEKVIRHTPEFEGRSLRRGQAAHSPAAAWSGFAGTGPTGATTTRHRSKDPAQTCPGLGLALVRATDRDGGDSRHSPSVFTGSRPALSLGGSVADALSIEFWVGVGVPEYPEPSLNS